jgi:hypothetical protein
MSVSVALKGAVFSIAEVLLDKTMLFYKIFFKDFINQQGLENPRRIGEGIYGKQPRAREGSNLYSRKGLSGYYKNKNPALSLGFLLRNNRRYRLSGFHPLDSTKSAYYLFSRNIAAPLGWRIGFLHFCHSFFNQRGSFKKIPGIY